MCWNYGRSGLVAPFERLNHEFEFHYIFWRSRREEKGSHTNQPRHYWNEFRTAQEILDTIKPDRVVFMGFWELRTIALNIAARRRGVPTFIVQHGYSRSLENYLSLPTLPKPFVETNTRKPVNSPWQAIGFMLRSNFAREPLDSFRAIAMQVMARRTDHYRSQLRFRFRGRMPDWYITYSEETSEIHRQLDGAMGASIIPVGIPEFDPIFRCLASSKEDPSKSILLIDSPNAENRYGITTTSIERKVRFLDDLSRRFQQRGYRLVVKLHPETYEATWLPSPGNITYVRDQDVGALIQKAQACLGFDSTLVIPAIITRPTMLFELCESTLATNAREWGVATVVRGLECSNEEIDALIETKERPTEQLERFTQCFAHSADGNTTERLAEALRGPVL